MHTNWNSKQMFFSCCFTLVGHFVPLLTCGIIIAFHGHVRISQFFGLLWWYVAWRTAKRLQVGWRQLGWQKWWSTRCPTNGNHSVGGMTIHNTTSSSRKGTRLAIPFLNSFLPGVRRGRWWNSVGLSFKFQESKEVWNGQVLSGPCPLHSISGQAPQASID